MGLGGIEMSNEIKVNFKNLTEEEIKILMRLIEKSNKQKSELWKPEENGRYYYLNGTGIVECSHWIDSFTDNNRFDVGNVFKTKEEAKFSIVKQNVFVELQRYAIEHNEGELDWNDNNERKYCITYKHNFNKVGIFADLSRQCIGQIYFTSAEIASDAINEIGEDKIKKYLFGVEVEESEKY